MFAHRTYKGGPVGEGQRGGIDAVGRLDNGHKQHADDAWLWTIGGPQMPWLQAFRPFHFALRYAGRQVLEVLGSNGTRTSAQHLWCAELGVFQTFGVETAIG